MCKPVPTVQRMLFAALAGVALDAQAAIAAGYAAVDITPAGSIFCKPMAMNKQQQVVGYFSDGQVTRGFITGPAGASPQAVATLGGTSADLSDINDLGEAVGTASLPGDTIYRPVYRDPVDGSVRDLGGFGGDNGAASSINSKGQIAGSASSRSGASFGFVTKGSTQRMQKLARDLHVVGLTDTGMLLGQRVTSTTYETVVSGPRGEGWTTITRTGYSMLVPFAINRMGNFTGVGYRDDGSEQAFVAAADGSFFELPLPGKSQGFAINAHGDVAGSFQTGSSATVRAFLSTARGKYVDLNLRTVGLPAGVLLRRAFAINDEGRVAGYGNDSHCYLLSPQ